MWFGCVGVFIFLKLCLSLNHHHTQLLPGGAGGLSLLESFHARLVNEVILQLGMQLLLVFRVLAVSIATALVC